MSNNLLGDAIISSLSDVVVNYLNQKEVDRDSVLNTIKGIKKGLELNISDDKVKYAKMMLVSCYFLLGEHSIADQIFEEIGEFSLASNYLVDDKLIFIPYLKYINEKDKNRSRSLIKNYLNKIDSEAIYTVFIDFLLNNEGIDFQDIKNVDSKKIERLRKNQDFMRYISQLFRIKSSLSFRKIEHNKIYLECFYAFINDIEENLLKTEKKADVIRVIKDFASANFKLYKNESSLDYLNKSLEIYLKALNYVDDFGTNNSIADCYVALKDYKKGAEIVSKGEKYSYENYFLVSKVKIEIESFKAGEIKKFPAESFLKAFRVNPNSKTLQQFYIELQSECEDFLTTLKKNDNTEIYKQTLLKYFDETTTNTIIENNRVVNTQNIYFYKWEELFKDFYQNLIDVLDKSFDDISTMIEDYAVELLEQIMPYFYMFDREKTYQLILKLSLTTSKLVRRYLVEVASEYKSDSNIDDYKKMLDAKKKPLKEFAILVLTEINVENIEQILKSMYEKESSDAFRKVINECLVDISKKTLNSTTQIVDGKIEESISTNLTKTSLIESSKSFVVKNGKEPVVGVLFLNISTLPKLLWKEDKTEAPLTVVYNFINSFAMIKSHIPSVMGREMGTLFEENSLIEFTKEVHARWDGEVKTKWVFGLVSAFGGNYFVPILKKQIAQLRDAGRGQVVTNIVESLAIIGTSRALQIVDFISRKDKNKQVKNGVIRALEVASKELKLSKDELFIFDESGKSLKSLPKPNGTDDQVLAKESENLFKEIKKEFKEQAKLQKERLENSLSTGRFWKKSDWIELFTQNPLMKKFGISLIWGVYVNGELKSTFRFNEDGSFSDINDDTTVVVSDLGSFTSESYSDITTDAVTIPENGMISIVHPVELSKDEIDKWSTILSDYEIKQPFSQIDRVSFAINDEDKDLEKVEDFQGYMITRISLKSRLLKENWSTGWVEDGGCFYFYQKTFPEAQITAKLDFLGDCMGGYDDTVEVPLYGLSFYNNLHKDPIKLCEIPKRVFSEVYKTVKAISSSGSGFNENWKKCSW